MRVGRSRGVRRGEEPPRRLSELVYLRLRRRALGGVFRLVEVEQRALVRQRVKRVIRRLRGGTALLVPEHQIDPVVESRGDARALQRRAVPSQKRLGGTPRPTRQRHVAERGAVLLPRAQRQPARVAEEIPGEGEKLGAEFLDIRGGGERGLPRLRDGVEESIRGVVFAVLQSKVVRGRGAEQPVQDVPGGAVVRPVQVRFHTRLAHLLRALAKDGETFGVERAHGPGEIAIHLRVVEVQKRRVVIAEHPRHHRPLREVVASATGGEVKVEEVIEVAQATVAPSGRRRRQPSAATLEQRGTTSDPRERTETRSRGRRRRRRRLRRRRLRLRPRLLLRLRLWLLRLSRVRAGQRAHARLPRLFRAEREERRGAREPSRAFFALGLVEEHLDGERSERVSSPRDGDDVGRGERSDADAGEVPRGLKIRARVGHHQPTGFADQRGDLRGWGVEEDGLVGAAETRAVEGSPVFSATSHGGEGLLRLGVGRAGDAEERGGGLENLGDVVVGEIETPGWVRAVVVDVVGDVLAHGADVEDAMGVHVETQAADGVEADDVLEGELEHGDRGVVGLERERTGEQANPTAEFAVLARGRRRGIGGRGQHAGGCLQASGEVNHVVLALVQV